MSKRCGNIPGGNFPGGVFLEPGTAKATPKIEKYGYYIFTENICSARNPMQVLVFCKHVLIL